MKINTKEELIKVLGKQRTFGSVNDGEAWLLFNLAKKVQNSGTCMEIGSWMGRSSSAIALGLRGGAKLHTVDDHRGIIGAPDGLPEGESAREIFFNNLKAAGVFDRVEHHPLSSEELAPSWRQPIDYLFIDGAHDYDSVVRDTFNFAGYVKPGGWLVFHDVVLPGVIRAIREWFSETKTCILSAQRGGNVVAFEIGKPCVRLKLKTRIILKLVYQATFFIPDRKQPIAKIWRKALQSSSRRLLKLFN